MNQTTDYLNTPGCAHASTPPDEVEVVDPSHPLFGRRFRVTLLPHRTRTPQCVFVEFEAGLQIRIPLDSTNLRYSTPARQPLKLNYLSVQDLIALAQEWETLCSSTSKESGTSCPSMSGKKSFKN